MNQKREINQIDENIFEIHVCWRPTNSFLFFSGNGAAVAIAATSIATQWYLLRQDHTALNSTGRNYRTMEFSIRHSRHTFKHVETYHFITIDKENETQRERE